MMKNLINYYYNLILTKYKKNEEEFFFVVDNINYVFLPVYEDINILYKKYLLINSNKRYCHEIIINKDKSIVTLYDGKPYILLRKKFYLNDLITLDDIIEYDILIYDAEKLGWKEMWKSKIDYYEYQINQLGIKYKCLKQCFNYYVGITETALSLLNLVDYNKVDFYICHKRIMYKEHMDTFYNPLNIIIDSRTRDIAEYLKINYLNDEIDLNDTIACIDRLNFSYNEIILLLARLLYPSYYFDMHDKIVQGKLNEEKLQILTKKNAKYEAFLKEIYKYIRLSFGIPEIEWLTN